MRSGDLQLSTKAECVVCTKVMTTPIGIGYLMNRGIPITGIPRARYITRELPCTMMEGGKKRDKEKDRRVGGCMRLFREKTHAMYNMHVYMCTCRGFDLPMLIHLSYYSW